MTIREATKDWSNVGWGGSFWGMGATGIPPLSSVIREVVNLPPDRFGRKSIYIGIKRPDGSEARGVLPQHVMPSGQDLVMVGEALKSSIGKSLDEARESHWGQVFHCSIFCCSSLTIRLTVV
jgi:hypothetical protein